ncbi:hypothetical protein GUITHDRAFT_117474 [Guillardia theta CCMP2712]|uniref:Uncharacterized protein n=1 Tax=Guillardia theta (strain CCMP2712) TaxID=905079 RepID=L1IKP5_GUITC|nr:hypothetical protein GUITHDRAFT_117474 [Guillardia theta CCMP2712]EKX36365.1 hypothetical protein GUITHDRAFT_117474 [Guillardia theta CCMP2712]|eukprot:XP_005823345.1 hypothetical protein GUITHDRAFT_117474 [Guillardia theta CCMP2712]
MEEEEAPQERNDKAELGLKKMPVPPPVPPEMKEKVAAASYTASSFEDEVEMLRKELRKTKKLPDKDPTGFAHAMQELTAGNRVWGVPK